MKEHPVSDNYFKNDWYNVYHSTYTHMSYQSVIDWVESWDDQFEGVILRVEDRETGLISETYFDNSERSQLQYRRRVNKLLSTHNLISLTGKEITIH